MKSNFIIEALGGHIQQFSNRNKNEADIEVYSVTNSEGFTRSTDYFSKEVFSKDVSNYKVVNRNQFAYNPSRINVGSIDYLRNEDKVLVSPLYIVFETNSNLDEDYLLRFLKSDWGNIQIRANTEGAVRDSLKYKGLEKIKIPLPPLEDQKRIAHLLSKVEGMIARRKQHLQQLDELLKSVFLEMFGDPVRNEKGWEKIKIDDFAEVRIGPFGSLLHSEDYIENGIPLINPSHMIDGEIIPDKTQTITTEKYWELEAYQLRNNDIVVARRGEIGRCALVRTTTPLFCGTGSMFIRITTDYYPLLLQYQIYNTSLKEFLFSKAKGVTMKNLNSTTLGNLQVLNPPISLQIQFATIISKVESLKTRYQSSLSNLENLYGALSQKAFKGELDLGRVDLEDVTMHGQNN
jgi:type I restriction enzyme S subunit